MDYIKKVYTNKLLLILLALDLFIKLLIIILFNDGWYEDVLPFLRLQHYIEYDYLYENLIFILLFGVLLYVFILKYNQQEKYISNILFIAGFTSLIFDRLILAGSFNYINILNFSGEFNKLSHALNILFLISGFIFLLYETIKEE